ncbi:molybdenum cofactor guanylyltransferase [Ktedonobacter racemifer]|uniref:Probable molybdenum cofactor guanylyltransferase n=1 Tax=Ktedonobacter racemifer DSM 44963 TaxID=485913 RepID=D6TEB3_KTERA|nr:molybdenum cofactor guanylyltransferase [Ktedonobacter racemifer]EFH90286.1 MobA family protein [Ktedonobacter racemifer DSM 44963]
MRTTAGILLVGGRSRRMGRDKALLPLRMGESPGQFHVEAAAIAEQQTFVAYLTSLLRTRCSEVILVARDEEQGRHYALPGVRIVADVEADIGPLMGLYSGLQAIEATHALVAAVDMPFVQPAMLDCLLAQRLDEAIVVPRVEQIPQVLLAVYPRALLPLIEERLRAGRRDPRSLLEKARVHYLEEAQLRRVDPDLRSFVNVNTPEELQKAGL